MTIELPIGKFNFEESMDSGRGRQERESFFAVGMQSRVD